MAEGASYRVINTQRMPFGLDVEYDLKRLGRKDFFRVLFDVGANCGQIAVRFFKHFPRSNIYAFEPFPSCFAKLRESTKSIPQIKCIQYACGSKREKLTVPIGCKSDSVQNPLLNLNKNTNNQSTVEVNVIPVDDFCDEQRIDRINLLKTDTEGYDIEVLAGAVRRLEKGKIDFIFAECEFDRVTSEPHTSFFKLYEFLRPFHYRVVSIYTDVAGRDGFNWGNVLFSSQKL